MRISHLQLFLKICLKLNFRQIKNVVLWYHRERKREKRERNERDKREPVSLPPSPLTLYGERKERVKKERRERKREYPHLGKNSAGDVYAVCADSAAGRPGETLFIIIGI